MTFSFRESLLRIQSFARKKPLDEDLAEEMASHLQMLTDTFLAQGLTPREARSAALRQAGNLTARGEEICRDSLASDEMRRRSRARLQNLRVLR